MPAAKDSFVYALSKPSRCYGCDTRLLENEIVQLRDTNDEREVLCKRCAGLDNLRILPSGNAKMTRLAKRYSKKVFVILKWSELWKTYERQGLLLEAEAIKLAEKESL